MIRQTIRRHYGQPLTEGPIWIALVRLSVPIILSNILQTAYQLTDTFWVGRLSAPAVAAVSLSFPITFLCISLGGGLPIAGTVLIAQFRGRGDRARLATWPRKHCCCVSQSACCWQSVVFFFPARSCDSWAPPLKCCPMPCDF